MIKAKQKTAFTLAEVLLTLAIIGIVAAMTIPSLISDIQDMDKVAKLRKAQSTYQQAIRMYMANTGITDLAASGLFVGAEQPADAWNAFKPYFNLAKDCGVATGQGCFPPGVMYKWLNGTNFTVVDTATTPKMAKGILADGTLIYLFDYGTWAGVGENCEFNNSKNNAGPLYKTVCGVLDVDVNGFKGPNQFGLDMFEFRITRNGTLYPTGALDDNTYGCSRTGSTDAMGGSDGAAGSGLGCTYKLLKDGKINY